MFEVEAVSLGELSQCIVGHDGDGIGEGWYLDEIVVREGPDAPHEYVFTCCRFVGRTCGQLAKLLNNYLKLLSIMAQP